MKLSNCLVFAFRTIWKKGGYILARRSRYTWVPHFLWTPNLDGLVVQDVDWSKKGGYLVIGHGGKFGLPSFMWTPSIQGLYVEHYAPVSPKHGFWFKLFPFATLVFEGSVRHCDAKDCDGKFICSVRKCSSKIGTTRIPTDEEYAMLLLERSRGSHS
jgi:hypothetical protein